MQNRAGMADAVRALEERQRLVQMGGAPRFLIAVDEQGFHIRETILVDHREKGVTVSGRREVHYQTYIVATGTSLPEAVQNARIGRWRSE